MDHSLFAYDDPDTLLTADLIPEFPEATLDPCLHDEEFCRMLWGFSSTASTQQGIPGYSSGHWIDATPKHEQPTSIFVAREQPQSVQDVSVRSSQVTSATNRKRKYKSTSNLQSLSASPKRAATPKRKWDSDSSSDSEQLLTQNTRAIPPSPSLQMQTTPVMKRSASAAARVSTLMPFDMFKVFGEKSNTKALGEVNRKIKAIADSEKRGGSMTVRTSRPSKSAAVPSIFVRSFTTNNATMTKAYSNEL